MYLSSIYIPIYPLIDLATYFLRWLKKIDPECIVSDFIPKPPLQNISTFELYEPKPTTTNLPTN